MFRRDADLIGCFATSKCGHDAGECYVIVSAAGNMLHVANGKNRPIHKPKKKNRVHLFVTRQAVPGIRLLLNGEPISSNLKLAGHISDYKKRTEQAAAVKSPRM